MGLSPKQEKFVEEYLIDLNATQAAIRAGYSKKTSDVQGPRLLGNVGVSRAIAEAKAERSARTALDADYVLTKLQQNIERAMQEIQVTDMEGKPTGEYRYDGAVANRALELIGKHLGMFVERIGDPNGKPLAGPQVVVYMPDNGRNQETPETP